MNEKAPLSFGAQWPEGRNFGRQFSVPEYAAAYLRALDGYRQSLNDSASIELAATNIVTEDFKSRHAEFIDEGIDTSFEADFEEIYADSPRHQAGLVAAWFGHRDALIMGGHEDDPVVEALEILIKSFSETFSTFRDKGAPQPAWVGGKYLLDTRFPVMLRQLGVGAIHG
jgi:hypothetical protein